MSLRGGIIASSRRRVAGGATGATWFTDFDGYTADVGALPSDWTLQFGGGTFSVVDSGGGDLVLVTGGVRSDTAVTWDAPNVSTVVETLALGQLQANDSSAMEVWMQWTGGSIRCDLSESGKLRFRGTASASTNTGIAPNGVDAWIRMVVGDGAAKAKAWLASVAEPGAWQLIVAVSAGSDIRGGFHQFRNPTTWRTFGVGIDGASAPDGGLL